MAPILDVFLPFHKPLTWRNHRLFLAQWARLLSWAKVARSFRVGWADVYGAVKWAVEYGLENRDFSGGVALGVDEIHVCKKNKFWTLVYQIDHPCNDRTEKTFDLFFEVFGTEFCAGNAKVKLTLKSSHGFRTEKAREVALYHALMR